MANTLCRTISDDPAARVAARRVVLALTLACATPAFAGPQCTSAPARDWTPIDALKKKIVERGYKIDVLKVTKGNCYELYGRDPAGKRVEIYYHPITLDAVRTSVR